MNEERVIPIEIINGLIEVSCLNPVSTESLNSDNDNIRELAEENQGKQWEYLLTTGLSEEECNNLLDKSIAYSDLKAESDFGMFTFGFILLIIAVAATIGLAWLNLYLFNEHHRIWVLPIALNIGALLVALFSLKTMGGSIYQFFRLKIKKGRKNEDDKVMQEYGEYANYLIKEHNYTPKALFFTLSDSGYDLVELKAFIDRLFPNKK